MVRSQTKNCLIIVKRLRSIDLLEGKRGVLVFRFQKLDVYKLSLDFVSTIYTTTRTLPAEEKYVLASQMNRAVVSISSNIAEGVSRNSRKDQIHFLNISYGSLMEIVAQTDILCRLGYINNARYDEIIKNARNLSVKIGNLMEYMRREIN